MTGRRKVADNWQKSESFFFRWQNWALSTLCTGKDEAACQVDRGHCSTQRLQKQKALDCGWGMEVGELGEPAVATCGCARSRSWPLCSQLEEHVC
jgi:hypothetical protein